MASTIILLTLSFLLNLKAVRGYYCDSGQCNEEHEYCCGLNICCTSYAVWQMWYFWCGCAFFLVLLSACAWFCRYRHYTTAIIIQGSTPYTRLDENQPVYPYSQSQDCQSTKKYSPDYPPPPYSQSLDAGGKDPGYMK